MGVQKNQMNEENECKPVIHIKMAFRLTFFDYLSGHLGDMLCMVYEINLNGLEYLFKPLRNPELN